MDDLAARRIEIVYVGACAALWWFARDAAPHTKWLAHTAAAGAALFSLGMASAAESRLLVWSAAIMGVTALCYALFRAWPRPAARSTPL